MKFHYKAQTKTGTLIEDTVEAVSQEDAVDKVRAAGATPIIVEQVKRKNIEINVPFIDNLFNGINLQDKILFSKNIAHMLRAGLSLSRALAVIKKQTKKKRFKEILTKLEDDIKAGGTLSEGLKKFPNEFSPLFVAMVHAGEESGNISDNLLDIGGQLEKTYQLRKKVKGAMMYPSVIVTAMLIIGILMFVFVVPTLLDTFRDFELELPITTRIVIFVSDFIQNNTLAFFGVLVALIGGVVFIFKSKKLKPYVDSFMLKIPVIGGIIKQMNAALICRTMSSLLKSGLPVDGALQIAQEVTQNGNYKETLGTAREYVKQGKPMSALFKEHEKLYPVMVGEMVEVGEETGKLVDMFADVAAFFEGEVENKTRNLSTIVEPILMIIIGAGVGFFALAMMSPMYSLVEGF